ncbi:hypothetical protein F5Y18DRAFT_397366 [Xylariaceae sp. FL1019]|nr:hypothetical protein F5Y18DRAFT_397366 [Xylariaceae sp. FL1019]
MFRSTEYLIPNVIRRRQHDQSRPFVIILSVNGSRQAISFQDLENCSNRAAWILDSLPDRRMLYMGPNDIRYAIWLIAAIKANKCVVFPSLVSPVSTNRRFFETVGCKTLLYAPEAKSQMMPLLKEINESIECMATPSYDDLMNKEGAPTYPFNATFDEVQHEAFLILHTSGTSGHPKPVFWTPLAVSSLVSYLDPTVESADGETIVDGFREIVQGNDMLVPLPLSHFGGIGNVMGAVYSDTTLVLPAPGTDLTPHNITCLLQESKCSSGFFVPFLLESLINHPPGLEALKRLKHVAYTGGPLDPILGRALAEKLPHLFNVLASTEGGVYCLHSTTDSAHWNSFKFFNVGQRMEEVSPGNFELVFPRSELVDRTYSFFHTSEDPHNGIEFRTPDLFSPLDGDSQSEWWLYHGRKDNWFIMSNGFGVNTNEIESAITSHPEVTGALIAGSRRASPCLLIELADNEQIDQHDRHETILKTLWPTIEPLNAKISRFGRVPKELILFATPSKPFNRTAKGTIQRLLTVQAYEPEINELYENGAEGLVDSGLSLPPSMAHDDLVLFLETLCNKTLVNQSLLTSTTAVLFVDHLMGQLLDSRSAFVMIARLKGVLRRSGVKREIVDEVDTLLFQAPTVRELAEMISQLVAD